MRFSDDEILPVISPAAATSVPGISLVLIRQVRSHNGMASIASTSETMAAQDYRMVTPSGV